MLLMQRGAPSSRVNRMKSSMARSPLHGDPSFVASTASPLACPRRMSMAMCSRRAEQWSRWYSALESVHGLGFNTEHRGSCDASASRTWSASLPYTQWLVVAL